MRRTRAIAYTFVGLILLSLIGVALLYQMLPIFNVHKFKKETPCKVNVTKFQAIDNTLTIFAKYRDCGIITVSIEDLKGRTMCAFQEQPTSPLVIDLTTCNLNSGSPYFVKINGKQKFVFYYSG